MAAGLKDGVASQAEPALLTVDLGALRANWRLLRGRATPAECAAVVKADAYGIGIEQAVPALAAEGCRTFFVAHLSEARRLRAVSPDATVYVLNGLMPGAAPAYPPIAARPILGSAEEIAEWAAFCDAAGERLPAGLHVDTGMNRLGLPVPEALALAGGPLSGRFRPALLLSHLVAAEDPDDSATARQAALFDRVRSAFPGVPCSLANSSGLFADGVRPFDLVRPGYALYGGNPIPGRSNPMQPVVRLETTIVQVREIGRGERVGYNGRWTARKPSRLATLSIGYADGYPRSGGGTDGSRTGTLDTAVALVAGVPCPFVGRISMDLIVLDVSDVPNDRARRGTVVTLIGDGLGIDEVGRRCGTIGYEILTSLGRRYRRTYADGRGGCPETDVRDDA